MNRKDEHIKLSLLQTEQHNDFDNVRFVHNAINDCNIETIDLTTSYANYHFPLPIYINAMTGGTIKAKEINKTLALLANKFKIPMASGSMAILLKNQEAFASFQVIKENNRDGVFIANIGADQEWKSIKKIIDWFKPNILQIHLNIPQELIMKEGNKDFRKIENNIKEIMKNVDIPVIVKEVGFGMSRKTMSKLKELGVKTIDVGGKGGTNFIKIENERREKGLEYLNLYGLSTVESLLEATTIPNLEILASGGIRNPFDAIKALSLGAKAIGMAKYFLKLVTDNSIDDAIFKFNEFIEELKIIMTMLGVKNVSELQELELIFSPSLESFLRQRNISYEVLIKRKR